MKNREQVTIGHLWGAFYPVLMYLGITVVAGIILTSIAIFQGQITIENKTVDFGNIENDFLWRNNDNSATYSNKASWY